jgi:hypothetical protein
VIAAWISHEGAHRVAAAESKCAPPISRFQRLRKEAQGGQRTTLGVLELHSRISWRRARA